MCVCNNNIHGSVAELRDRGHDVTLYNRGKTPAKQIPGESDAAFAARKEQTKYLKGDRSDPEQLKSLIDPSMYSCKTATCFTAFDSFVCPCQHAHSSSHKDYGN